MGVNGGVPILMETMKEMLQSVLPTVDKRFELIMIRIPYRIILCLDYDFMFLDAISSHGNFLLGNFKDEMRRTVHID